MNPKQRAILIYEAMAVAMQKGDDPIWILVRELQSIRDMALDDAAKLCLDAQDDGLEQSIQDYNAGCEDCAKGIMFLKGKVSF